MSENPAHTDRPAHTARIKRRRTFLVIESLAIIGLVAAVLWVVQNYSRRSELIDGLSTPGLWLIVILASCLGAAGGLVPYYLGQRGKEAVFSRYPQLEGGRWERIEAGFQRWGARILALSGVPTLGFALLLAAGVFHIRRNAFLLWAFVGKLLRNVLVVISLLLAAEIVL